MAEGYQVLEMLLPGGGWAISGDTYEGITFVECEAITKEEFLAGFAKYDAWKMEQNKARESARQDLLNRLGITAQEAKLLLS